jgi:hypothetical protein
MPMVVMHASCLSGGVEPVPGRQHVARSTKRLSILLCPATIDATSVEP